MCYDPHCTRAQHIYIYFFYFEFLCDRQVLLSSTDGSSDPASTWLAWIVKVRVVFTPQLAVWRKGGKASPKQCTVPLLWCVLCWWAMRQWESSRPLVEFYWMEKPGVGVEERLAGGGRTHVSEVHTPRGRNPIHSRGSCIQTNNGYWGVVFHQMTRLGHKCWEIKTYVIGSEVVALGGQKGRTGYEIWKSTVCFWVFFFWLFIFSHPFPFTTVKIETFTSP